MIYFTRSTFIKDIPAQWQRFGPYIGTVPGQVGRVAYGVCFNPSDDGFDYLTGVEVSDFTHLPEELARLTFPARRYAVFIHLDHVSKLGDMIPAIFMKWLPASGHEPIRNSGFFERYGEGFNVESGRGDIEIWIPIH